VIAGVGHFRQNCIFSLLLYCYTFFIFWLRVKKGT
jgi:cbb3-type cytochrome oxidase subunit 3